MNEEEQFTIMRLNPDRPIGDLRYTQRSPSDGHLRVFSSTSSSSSSSSLPSSSTTSTATATATKPNPKFLAFFLQTLVMGVVIILFFLFVGIAAIVLIHIAIAGRSIHRRRLRRANTSRYDSFDDDLDFGGVGFGLSHRDLRKIPAFYYGSGEESVSGVNPDCAVCLEGFKEGDRCRILPKCKHVFHANCIDSWLIRVPACPFCRGTVDPNVEAIGSD